MGHIHTVVEVSASAGVIYTAGSSGSNRPLVHDAYDKAQTSSRDHLSRADGAARSSGRYSSTVAVNVLPERRAVTAPDTVSVSVVIPCLNEEDSIGQCVAAARRVLDEHALDGEVLVVDNGSDDNSANLARFAGARVVEEPRRGYGSAYLAGFAAARGDYIVMIDADLTYDFEEIPRFVQELDNGAELVMGNRMEPSSRARCRCSAGSAIRCSRAS